MDPRVVTDHLLEEASIADLDAIKDHLTSIRDELTTLKEQGISLLTVASNKVDDAFIDRKLREVDGIVIADPTRIPGNGRRHSTRHSEHNPRKRTSAPRAGGDDCIEAEAAAEPVHREEQHQKHEKKLSPRPVVVIVVEAEPKIQSLQRADDPPKSNEQAENEGHRGQHFQAVDNRCE